MKDIKNYLANEYVNEAIKPLTPTSRVTSANVHDAILTLLFKYLNKPGVSQEVQNYCDKVREALDTIK